MHIFDHKTRVGPSNWHKLGEGNRAARGPLFRAHVDQSYAGAELVLRRHFPEEADELLHRRYQIINVLTRPPRLLRLSTAALASISHVDNLNAILYPSRTNLQTGRSGDRSKPSTKIPSPWQTRARYRTRTSWRRLSCTRRDRGMRRGRCFPTTRTSGTLRMPRSPTRRYSSSALIRPRRPDLHDVSHTLLLRTPIWRTVDIVRVLRLGLWYFMMISAPNSLLRS